MALINKIMLTVLGSIPVGIFWAFKLMLTGKFDSGVGMLIFSLLLYIPCIFWLDRIGKLYELLRTRFIHKPIPVIGGKVFFWPHHVLIALSLMLIGFRLYYFKITDKKEGFLITHKKEIKESFTHLVQLTANYYLECVE